MGTKGTWLAFWAFLLAAAPPGTAAPSPGAPSPTPTPVPSSTPAVSPTPSPAPLRAPTWAPTSAGIEPGNHPVKKGASPWMSLTGLGVAIPASANFKSAYDVGFGVDLGTGYRLSNQFSLWLDLGLTAYGSYINTATVDISYTIIDAALLARYQPITSVLSPYVFAGPGLAYNEVRNVDNTVLDTALGYFYIPVSAYEFDLLLEGGAGVELGLGQGAAFFLEGKVLCDIPSSSFANNISIDNQTLAIQVELGTLFGL